MLQLLARSLVVCLILSFIQVGLRAQQPTQSDPRVDQIISKAIEVLGGASYLNVRSVTSRGFYTAYQDGASQIPARFVDYIVYPDRERTEFTGGGGRVIQSNSGNTGWVFDGAAKSIKEMSSAQVEDFKRTMRTSLENLLRGWWKNEGGKLTYAGRREAGLAKRNETVRLTYPDGFWIEYEFGAKDGLPAKIIYKRTRSNPDSGETEEVTEEERLARMITVEGVTAPWVIDHFTNNIQTSRTNYESVEYNKPLPDSLFVKPENVKSIK
jgi:hypothetical protein